MATKEPPEVAGLGRPETPEEKFERVAKARAERRSRQNMRNLIWSLLASLGVVALLVIVVVRPDDSLIESVEWQAVAAEASESLPSPALSPMLSELWEANRAEVTKEPGAVATWSIGLLGPEQTYVFLDQGFGADAAWVARRVEQSSPTGAVTLGYGAPHEVVWDEYDRRSVDPGGNRSYVVVTKWNDSMVAVGGTNKRGVEEVANEISYQMTMNRTP
jgi:hypothetical protein